MPSNSAGCGARIGSTETSRLEVAGGAVRSVPLVRHHCGQAIISVNRAAGRYILAVKEMTSLLEMSQILRKVHKYPWLLPKNRLPNWLVMTFGPLFGLPRRLMRTHLGIHFKLGNSRSIKELGVVYRPLEQTLIDHYRSWLELRKAKKRV